MGEYMKFEELDENKYLFFTYDIESLGNISDNYEENISRFLKEIFLNINDIYSTSLFGYYKVDIYIDEKIGAFVEIEKLDDYVSYNKKIDTKVCLHDSNFYFKTNDLSKIYKYKTINYLDGNYYISTKDVDNIFDLMDICSIEYKDIDSKCHFI